MKKSTLISILCLLGVFGLLFIVRETSLRNEVKGLQEELVSEKSSYPDIYNVINAITLHSFKTKIQDKTDFVVYVGRPTCGDCTEFEPKLIEMLEEKELQNELLYLNVAQLRKKETEWNNFKEKYNIQYTPTLAKFDHGKLVKKVNWTPENGTNLNEFNDFLDEL